MKFYLKLEPRPITQPGIFEEKVLDGVTKETRTDYITHAYLNYFFLDGSSESFLESAVVEYRRLD